MKKFLMTFFVFSVICLSSITSAMAHEYDIVHFQLNHPSGSGVLTIKGNAIDVNAKTSDGQYALDEVGESEKIADRLMSWFHEQDWQFTEEFDDENYGYKLTMCKGQSNECVYYRSNTMIEDLSNDLKSSSLMKAAIAGVAEELDDTAIGDALEAYGFEVSENTFQMLLEGDEEVENKFVSTGIKLAATAVIGIITILFLIIFCAIKVIKSLVNSKKKTRSI